MEKQLYMKPPGGALRLTGTRRKSQENKQQNKTIIKKKECKKGPMADTDFDLSGQKLQKPNSSSHDELESLSLHLRVLQQAGKYSEGM